MKNKIVIAGLLVAAASLAQAQTTSTNVSTSSVGSTYQKLKEGPLDLSFYLAAENTRDSKTNESNGVLHTDMVYLGYKLSPNDSLKLENRVVTTNKKEIDSVSSWSRAVLSYKRSNILTEKNNGVGLSATLEKRYVPDATARAKNNQYGINRVSMTATNTFGNLSLANTAYFAINDVRDKSDLSTFRNYIYGLFTQSYALPSDFSISLTEEILKDNNELNEEETNDLTVTAEVGKQITPEFAIGLSVAANPISTTDGSWTQADNWGDRLTYGMNLSITAF